MKVPSLQDVETSIKSINWYRGIAAAVFYGFVSGSMSFMNKVGFIYKQFVYYPGND
jgi:hypothetical protein